MGRDPSKEETQKKQSAHRPCKVALKLLDDSCKTSACQVKKFPAAAHGGAIPAWRGVLLLSRDVAFRLMVKVELDKSSEFKRVCQEET